MNYYEKSLFLLFFGGFMALLGGVFTESYIYSQYDLDNYNKYISELTTTTLEKGRKQGFAEGVMYTSKICSQSLNTVMQTKCPELYDKMKQESKKVQKNIEQITQ